MTWPMLGIHLYETLTVFLFMIFDNGWEGGKHVSINFKNLAPTLVDTFREKGGLKYVILLDLFRFPQFCVERGSNLSVCE